MEEKKIETEIEAVENPLEEKRAVASAVNKLLASYVVASQNFHALHWLVRGKDFFTLHAKFEELYNETLETVDVLAERVLTLGFIPDFTLERYLAISAIKSLPFTPDGEAAVKAAIEILKSLCAQLIEATEIADSDEVTEEMLAGLLGAHEKAIWMFSAYLNEAPAALGD